MLISKDDQVSDFWSSKLKKMQRGDSQRYVKLKGGRALGLTIYTHSQALVWCGKAKLYKSNTEFQFSNLIFLHIPPFLFYLTTITFQIFFTFYYLSFICFTFNDICPCNVNILILYIFI